MDRPVPDTAPSAAAPGAAIDLTLVGYLQAPTGIGAAGRAYAAAVRAAGLAVRPVDVSDLAGQASAEGQRPEAGPAGGVNLVCTDVAQHFGVVSRLGREFFRGRYNVGIWAWELPRFPQAWCDRFAYFDEVWVGTSFIANALGAVSPVPVVRVPPPLTAAAGDRAAGRRRAWVADDEFLFLFVCDFRSLAARKNPRAVVEAFRRAFRPDDKARLVVKLAHAESDPGAAAELRAARGGYRIDVHDGVWPADYVRDLMAACDAYVSLHRAEGTGLTISDAMALGKPVIATGWSGNMDFMTVANSYPVRYVLTELQADIGPYTAGEVWAEPCLDHAAALMREVYDHPDRAAEQGRVAAADIAGGYSEERVGRLIAQRLETIARRGRLAAFRERLWEPPADLDTFIDSYRDLGEYVPCWHLQYQRIIDRIRAAVEAAVPAGATVLVVSRGDADLLTLGDRAAWHFPRAADGQYAGNYPADDAEAIRHLEELKANGAEYLLLPSPSFWWLDHYAEFGRRLEADARVVAECAECKVYQLVLAPAGPRHGAHARPSLNGRRPPAPLRLAIVSTPRSGNTWLRRLIGSLYDIDHFSAHNPADVNWDSLPEQTVLQLHWTRAKPFLSLLDRHRFRVVVLARHPLDVLISILHFIRHDQSPARWLEGENGDERSIVSASPMSPAFLEYATGPRAASLLSVSREWWPVAGCVPVRYEHLVADTAGELRRLATRLGVEPRRNIGAAVAANTMARLRQSDGVHSYHYWKGYPGHWKTMLCASTALRVADAHEGLFRDLAYVCDPAPDLTAEEADANWLRALRDQPC